MRQLKELRDVLNFDKKFNGLPLRECDTVLSFSHVSAEEMKGMVVENGDVRLLSVGQFDGYTTKDIATDNLCYGEVITIPTGGNANFKYYHGYFVDSGNILCSPKEESVYGKYVYYCLCHNIGLVDSMFRGASIRHPQMAEICRIKIPIGTYTEQQRVVTELDLLSEIIDKQKNQLKELDTLAQSVYYDMFGDPVKNEKGWETKCLGEIATIKTGPFGSMLHKEDYVTGGIPLINPIHMRNFVITADNNFSITNSKAKELSAYLLKKDDVVFARRGDIGRCAIVSITEEGYLCGTGSLFVRFNTPISPQYVMFIVRSDSFKGELVSKAKGATMLNLNSATISNLYIPVPPLSLQHSFAQKIEAIEEQKARINASIAETQKLFDYTMDKYFG